MDEHGLKHVFFATDLVEGNMPELDASNPATTLPRMCPEHRQQVVEGAEEVSHLIREDRNPMATRATRRRQGSGHSRPCAIRTRPHDSQEHGESQLEDAPLRTRQCSAT
jgi:hypothetical protein